MSTRPLRVVLVWRGEPLEERLFTRPCRITIGSGKRDTFTVPESRLGNRFPLFSKQRGGFALTLAEGMTGKLSLGGHAKAVSRLLAEGGGQAAGPHRRHALTPADWGIVSLDDTGEVAFFFQFLASAVRVGPPPSFLDRFLGQALAFSAVVHVALLVLAFISWEPQDALDVDPPASAAIAKLILEKPPEPQPEDKQSPEKRRVREEDASKRADKKEGKIGNPDAKLDKTVIPKGPKDQVVAKVSQTGLLGVLKKSDQSQALKSLLSDTPDATLTTAMAGLKGAQLAIGRGSGGMSTRGDGPGGGGTGPGGQLLGTGELAVGGGGRGARNTGTGPGRVAKELKVAVQTGTPTSDGGLSKEQILKVVQSHAAAIQFCYEKELQRFPHLSGKVVLAWQVEPEGRVLSAKVDSSSLGNPSAESCMSRQVKNWTFPKSSGPTHVVFPFFFKGQ